MADGDGDGGVAPADLARLKARPSWAAGDATPCAAGHRDVRLGPDEVPWCARCGASLSPDALRRAGIRGKRA